MKKVGSTTDTADSNGEYTNGNVANGISPTIINAEMLNTFQRELVAIVEGAGITLDPDNDAQVLAAIKSMVGGGRLLNVQVFNASGLYTRTTGATKGIVHVVGGGGGGGGARSTGAGYLAGGAGGGAGGFASGFITLPASQNVVIGAGGAGGVNTGDTGSGGTSSFGTITATGGGAGASSGLNQTESGNAQQQTGGAPGVGSGGNIVNSYGGPGHNLLLTSSSNSCAGAGGASHYSGSPLGAVGTSGNGSAGVNGSGGSGALSDGSPSASYQGGTGGNGLVIIWEYA